MLPFVHGTTKRSNRKNNYFLGIKKTMDLEKTLRELRKELKSASIKDVETYITRLNKVLEEKKLEKKQADEARQAEEMAIQRIIQSAQDQGLDLDNLVRAIQEPKSKPKYTFDDEDGVTHHWSGQGRTPSALKSAMKRLNKPQDYFLTEKN